MPFDLISAQEAQRLSGALQRAFRRFQSTLPTKKMTIRAARMPMSGEISIHAVAIAYGVYRLARRIFPSTASAAAASAKNSSANSAALTVP